MGHFGLNKKELELWKILIIFWTIRYIVHC